MGGNRRRARGVGLEAESACACVTSSGETGGVTVVRDVPVPMRDGVQLFADVYRPEGSGPHPVLLMRVPYSKDHAQTIAYAHPYWYASRGHVVVVQDTRGRYRSEGDFELWRHEGEDGYDSVEWAAALPDTNGRVGMYGFSYAGALQLQAAALRPPHLRAIAPAFASVDAYGDWIYPGGALSWAFIASWCPSDVAAESARRLDDSALQEHLQGANRGVSDAYWHLPICRFPNLPERVAPYFHEWLAHPSRDDYWRTLDPAAVLSTVDVPALHIGGWADVFIEGTLNSFSTLAASKAGEQQLVIGPWMHMPWTPWVLPEEEEGGFGDVDLLQLRWFERWLKPTPAGPAAREPAPAVKVFTMGEERWTTLASWPESTELMVWYLHSRGRANSRFGDGTLRAELPEVEDFDTFVYDPANPVPSLGGRSCCDASVAPIGFLDQRSVEERRDVLVYTSEPFADPIDVRGRVTLVIWAASSAVDTDFTGKLVDVDADGTAINVVDGIVRVRHRDPEGHESLVEPEDVHRLELNLGSACWRLAAGHRLRLEVSSSNFPRYSRNANSAVHPNTAGFSDLRVAVQRVFHDHLRPSALALPIADARAF